MQFKKYDTKLFEYQRRVLGLSRKELGDICRCSEQTILFTERGARRNEQTIIVIGLALEGLAEEQGIKFEGNAILIP